MMIEYGFTGSVKGKNGKLSRSLGLSPSFARQFAIFSLHRARKSIFYHHFYVLYPILFGNWDRKGADITYRRNGGSKDRISGGSGDWKCREIGNGKLKWDRFLMEKLGSILDGDIGIDV